MTTFLLDSNVLVAMTIEEHEHHERVVRWLTGIASFAVCPTVEGALARFLMRIGERPGTVAAVLDRIRRHDRCTFWPSDLSYGDVDLGDLRGHRQVTDGYLAALAARRSGLLATLDEALVTLRPTQTQLIPA